MRNYAQLGGMCGKNSLLCAEGRIFSGGDKEIYEYGGTTLTGHSAKVMALAIGDGKLFSGSWDATIKVWDLVSFREIATLTEHKSRIHALVVAKGKLYSGSLRGPVLIWNLRTLAPEGQLDVLEGGVTSLLAVGDRLYAGQYASVVLVWSLSTHQPIAMLRACGQVLCLAATADRLYSGTMIGSIQVWDINSIVRLEAHEAGEMSICTEAVATLQSDMVGAGVYSLAAVNGRLYAGTNYIRVWDTTVQNVFTELPPCDGEHFEAICGLAVVDGKVYSCTSELLSRYEVGKWENPTAVIRV
jgi:F-box/WD-40 domain protein 7